MAQTSSKKRHIHSENTYRYLLLLALLLTVTTLIRFIAFRSTFFLKFVFTCSQISLFLIGKILHSQVKSGSDITDGFINKALLKYVYLTFAIYGGAWITDAAWRGYWIMPIASAYKIYTTFYAKAPTKAAKKHKEYEFE